MLRLLERVQDCPRMFAAVLLTAYTESAMPAAPISFAANQRSALLAQKGEWGLLAFLAARAPQDAGFLSNAVNSLLPDCYQLYFILFF